MAVSTFNAGLAGIDDCRLTIEDPRRRSKLLSRIAKCADFWLRRHQNGCEAGKCVSGTIRRNGTIGGMQLSCEPNRQGL
jgi:hypothetical protein